MSEQEKKDLEKLYKEFINAGFCKTKSIRLYDLSQDHLNFLHIHEEYLRTYINTVHSFTHLRDLWVSGFDIKELPILDNFPALEELGIYNTKISKIQGLENTANLKILIYHNCPIEKIEGLESLENLQTLILSGTQISKIENLDNLRKLNTLNLRCNNIKKIENIDSLQSVTILSLYHQNSEKVEGLAGVLNLHNSNFQNWEKIENLEEILKLNNLKEFYIDKYLEKTNRDVIEYIKSKNPSLIIKIEDLKMPILTDMPVKRYETTTGHVSTHSGHMAYYIQKGRR